MGVSAIPFNLAARAHPEQLQPMVLDVVAALAADVRHERLEFIAAEIFYPAAVLADEQVLVACESRYKGMAAGGLVHPLD